MARIAIPLFLYAETPLHPGTGAHLGSVDLPVQRERHTGYPMIQGSSLKGVLRALATDMAEAGERGWEREHVEAIFGPSREPEKHAGAVAFVDARILLFPVRALGTVFAWTTSHDVLARLRRDLAWTGIDGLPDVPSVPESSDGAVVPPGSALLEKGAERGPIILEEFSYDARAAQEVARLGQWLAERVLPGGDAYRFWRDKLASDLVVLAGGEFTEFTKTATEVVTRIKLVHATKTVDKDVGGLWTEEHVPSDSVFYSLAIAGDPSVKDRPGDAVWVAERLRTFGDERIQVGGDETTGRGFVLLRMGDHGDGTAR